LKPFNPTELLQTIRKHLDEKAAERLRIWMEMEKGAKFSEQFSKSKGSDFSA
jgi:DNA-binding response OmpR family regulator